MKNSKRQTARQNARKNGRYKEMNRCEGYKKPLGDYDYFSLPNQNNEVEKLVGVFGLALCSKCFDKYEPIYNSVFKK